MFRGEREPDSGEAPSLVLDKSFLRSRKGMLLAAELALCMIVFICLVASLSSYMAAALLEFFITLAFLFIYSTQCYQRFSGLNWPCMDFLRCVSAVIIFLVVSIAAATRSGGEGGAVAAALFGFVLTAVFSYDVYEIYHAEMVQQDLASQSDPPTSRSDGCTLN
ncbi:CKLF-like MARVEL transmembrane domain-containing protein 5 [Microcaecilia unicolor]|uniref:CKLF-like MARVEL transmembrane domain-containing protein 5 n=1 Tax=Microcaecilia unicolor TaxID=1415580 RepID=A0A6P7WYF8_9AMPH|nr:CKLF-like MARVEL transmembrane domain-containing protein 5 [Microcaecilia unicolor]